MKNNVYVAPAMEIIPIASGNSIMAMITSTPSATIHNPGGGTAPSGGVFTRSPYGRANTSDLDGMISNILTVGQ